MKKGLLILLVLIFSFGLAHGASNLALSRASAKIGYNFDFEQLVLGADLNLGTLARDLYLVPQLEFSLGGDYSVFSIDGTLQYYFPTSGTIRPYAGGGLGFRTVSWDVGPGLDGSDTDFVLCVLGGADYDIGNPNMHLFTDLKIRFMGWGSDMGLWFGVSFAL